MKHNSYTIVAIDDTPSILTFLRISLEAQGYTFHAAATAASGLELCQQIKPDLVILDLGLPDRDGIDILPELKQDTTSKHPPVVVLTVRKEQDMRDKAMQQGADAYLSKPFLMEALLEIIHEKLPTARIGIVA
jgi:DNA-binding response OmpR family regulator